ncbi:MAG: DNA repair protein RecO [Oscillospiraceae bacterium]|nr:DNA repair protein RecO [Oscillospiraceae bacterium]
MQTAALVLRADEIKEDDRLITALTEQLGVVRAFANGAKKPKSPLHGACQPFAHGELELTRRRDTYVVTHARAAGVFHAGLASELSRLALAGYFGALCAALAPQEEPAPEHLRLMMNALHFLNAGLRPQWLLKAVVELRLICLAGYKPDLTGDGPYLDCVHGVIVPDAGARRVLLEPPVREAMRFICEAPLERAFRFTLPEEGLRALSFASQTYLQHQVGRIFDELAYWEGLK